MYEIRKDVKLEKDFTIQLTQTDESIKIRKNHSFIGWTLVITLSVSDISSTISLHYPRQDL